jgi:uncharacterized protein (TIGR03435 family)
MTPTERALKRLIGRHLPSPSQLELVAARDRVLDRLRSTPAHLQKARIAETPPAVSGWRTGLSLAAAAALIALVTTVSFQRADWLATVEAADGSRYTLEANTRLRADDASGTLLTLKDGSRVEMRSQSELSLERADDGLAIRLRGGGIIVDAAKQRSHHHLYVHTRDITASVAGTVFLVNAADDGSRVGVIEGEVRVREGATETTLRPGEQVATNPTLAARPMTEAVAWSRRGDAYAAILASFEKGMAETSGPLRPSNDGRGSFSAAQAGSATTAKEFEEASIRECDPDNVPPAPAGARGGGPNSFYMTPGRTYALCMTLATLIRTAHGLGAAGNEFLNDGSRARPVRLNMLAGLGVENGTMVRGGPDWVRSDRFTIEAVADPSAGPEAMSRTMLRRLLERRFQLKAHIDVEQIPAFTLSVAKGGLKMKPTPEGGCDELAVVPGQRPPPARSFADVRRGEKPSCGIYTQRNGPNLVTVGGGATIGGEGLTGLAKLLALRVGRVQVIDKTNLTGAYTFILEHALDENTEPSDIARGSDLFSALEEQLGLKLEPARAPREYIVIDHVERPSPN